MTKQTKRKGKTKMKNYQVNDVVQFMGDEYKVVEVLQMEDAVHIKKISAPGNSMVVPVEKLASGKYENMSEGSEPTVEEGEYFEQLLDAAFENMVKEAPTQKEADAEIAQVLEDLGHKLPESDKVNLPAAPEEMIKATQGSLMGY